MSYQSGSHRVVMGDTPKDEYAARVKPISFLEERKRRNRCISAILVVLFMSMFGCIVVWRIRHQMAINNALQASENGDDDGFSYKDSQEVSKGLILLNKHVHKQSKVIEAGCESTLLLIRHCEKTGPTEVNGSGNSHCSYVGHERAHFLATLFESRWPAPSYLFALTPERSDHLNFREYETLRPLSLKSGISIDFADHDNLASQYFALLKSGELCGKLTVVSWKHSLIPHTAHALGCSPATGCPTSFPEDSFDQVWQLKYVFHPSTNIDPADEKQFVKNETERKLVGGQNKKYMGWRVFGTVGQQNFDPLSFSYQAGDYPEGGTPTGGAWMTNDL